MKASFKKTLLGFVPYCEEGEKLFNSCELAENVMVEHTRGRNPDNHSRFFRLLNQTFDIQDSFEDKEHWRKQMLIMAGHFEMVIVEKPEWWDWMKKYLIKYLGGPHTKSIIEKLDSCLGVQLQAKSMAFEKMDETEFRVMFKSAVNAFLANYAPQMDDKTFLRILDFD